MEYFDIFDSENKPLSKIKERKLVHQDGDWHRTSQIWVMNYKKEILCNLRSPEKDLFPDYWDLSIGGHVVAGKTYEETALRELDEEIGINATLDQLKFIGDEKVEGIYKEKNLTDREHARLFLYISDRKIESLKVQREEIEEIKYISIDYLINAIETKKELKVIPIKHFFIKILNLLKNYPIINALEGE